MGNKMFIALVALPFLLVAAAVFGAHAVDFEELVFSPTELRVLHFSPETIEVRVAPRKQKAVARAAVGARSLTGLFRAGSGFAKTGPYASHPGSTALDPLAVKVSFIMLGGAGSHGSLAIVNDELVAEGGTVGGMLVKRIEEDKVLLKGKETRWIYMEGLR